MYLSTSHVIFRAYSESDSFGKLIFLALFSLSLTIWFVLIQKALLFQKCRKASIKMQETIKKNQTQILQISLHEDSSTNPFSSIYLALKEKTVELLEKNIFFVKKESVFLSDADIGLIEAFTMNAISKESKKLEKNLFVLSTSVSLAPFIGILGTVWGILICLAEMQKGGGVHSNNLILSGLSMALGTTVIGLVIAIPALIGHSYLKNSLKCFQTDMEDFSNLLISTIELQYRKVTS
jgi:biopolymer transport protein TolQ